jgi:hypothetical protein
MEETMTEQAPIAPAEELPEPELLLLNGTEFSAPEPLFDFSECSSLFALLINGLPPADKLRRSMIRKLASELARQS